MGILAFQTFFYLPVFINYRQPSHHPLQALLARCLAELAENMTLVDKIFAFCYIWARGGSVKVGLYISCSLRLCKL